MRIIGCCAKAIPAIAVDEGCVWIANRLAAAGLTAIVPEIALLSVPLVKAMVIFVATVCDKFVKVTMPPTAIRLVVPCNAPAPPLLVAMTTVALSPMRRLPN